MVINYGSIRQRLMISVALVVGPMSGSAWADCVEGAANQFTCSGATTTPQRLGPPLTNVVVTTTDTFGMTITGNPFQQQALRIWSDGLLTYIDNNESVIDTSAAVGKNGLSFVIGRDILNGNPASARVFSNGDIFSSANGVSFSGQGGLPESGRIDAEFTGNIVANSFGLSAFTGGLGSTYSVNNIRSGFSAVSLTIGSSGGNEAFITDDLILNTTGLVSGGNSLSFGSGIVINNFKSGNTDSGGIADNVGVVINVGSASIIEGLNGALSFNHFGNPLRDTSLNPFEVNNNGIIRNLSQASVDRAISGSNVRLVVNNENRIIGIVSLSGYDDRFNNDGVWDTANGINDFGAGSDFLANRGVVVAARNAAVNEITNFNSLDVFENNPTGVIQLNDGGAGDTTTTGGNYVGINGILALDTFLGDDSSLTDLFAITGSTAGSTRVLVNNVDGPGALTGLGIKIVDVGLPAGSTGRFELANGDYVIGRTGEDAILAGAYGYALRQNADDGDWYLQSEWQPATPIYEAFPVVLQNLQRLPRLQERVGNRHWAGQPAAVSEIERVFCKDPAQDFSCAVTPDQAQVFAGASSDTILEGSGAWVRVDGSYSKIAPASSAAGISIDNSTGSIELGIDRHLNESASGDRLIGGVSLRYTRSAADVTSEFGDGNIATDGVGIGMSLTWYDTNGLYVDAQARALWTRSDLSSTSTGTLSENADGFGYGLSLEVGKEFALSDTWTITPEAQLTYSNITADDFGEIAATVTGVESESLALRAGVVVANEARWTAKDGTTSRSAVNMGAHLTQEFRPESRVIVSGTAITSERDDLIAEITLGGTYNWSNDKYSVYGQLSAATGMNNFGDSSRIGVTVGARFEWE